MSCLKVQLISISICKVEVIVDSAQHIEYVADERSKFYDVAQIIEIFFTSKSSQLHQFYAKEGQLYYKAKTIDN
jgi:acetolactate synthase regulatory subunit